MTRTGLQDHLVIAAAVQADHSDHAEKKVQVNVGRSAQQVRKGSVRSGHVVRKVQVRVVRSAHQVRKGSVRSGHAEKKVQVNVVRSVQQVRKGSVHTHAVVMLLNADRRIAGNPPSTGNLSGLQQNDQAEAVRKGSADRL